MKRHLIAAHAAQTINTDKPYTAAVVNTATGRVLAWYESADQAARVLYVWIRKQRAIPAVVIVSPVRQATDVEIKRARIARRKALAERKQYRMRNLIIVSTGRVVRDCLDYRAVVIDTATATVVGWYGNADYAAGVADTRSALANKPGAYEVSPVREATDAEVDADIAASAKRALAQDAARTQPAHAEHAASLQAARAVHAELNQAARAAFAPKARRAK
ncbi:MAG: hypothetical protein ACOYBR_09675 [Fluviibacter sp.]